MSAAELRKAAETLHERAEAAQPGPWFTQARPTSMVDVVAVADDVDDCPEAHTSPAECPHAGCAVASTDDADKGACIAEDADYIATVHPGVGLALANLLEDMAIMHDETAIDTTRWPAVTRLARLINGGAS